MKKPASKGYEKRPTVVLQAHMDMVCEKNSDTVHDFMKDPIQPYIDGEWVKARRTTLGADNGIGMAAIMAILLDSDLKHPALECLINIEVKRGLRGDLRLLLSFLKCESVDSQ